MANKKTKREIEEADKSGIVVIENLYYSAQVNDMFTIPNGYTLLCPNIVNATRWP